jgi:hypothetical protein
MSSLDRDVIDLGKDRARMSDSHADRQHATVERLLRAFFESPEKRAEIQILADEVGLGKTFVALAVAYALLDELRSGRRDDDADWRKCYRAILVLTPASNHALAKKWVSEVEALLTRCSKKPDQTKWFKPVACQTPDQLMQALLRADDGRRKAPPILVAEGGIFTKRLADPAVRFLTACLFRWWGIGLTREARYHVVRGLAETAGSRDWEDAARWVARGTYEIDLWDWADHERFLAADERERADWPNWNRRLFAQVSLTYDEMRGALDRLNREKDGKKALEDLRAACLCVPRRQGGDARTIGYKEKRESFDAIKEQLRGIYKSLWPYLLRKNFPLIIADEAHHWRHAGRGDATSFRKYLAPFAKRLLLLTATPFQLRPDEFLLVLETSDAMESAIGPDRVAALRGHRDAIGKAMARSEDAGVAFSKEWGLLDSQFAHLDPTFASLGPRPARLDPRTDTIAQHWSALQSAPESAQPTALASVPGALRRFFELALDLRRANRSLQRAMAPVMIRHRRQTEHRRQWVGREYPPHAQATEFRPDQSILHMAPGDRIPPDAELAQYLLMKVVAEISRGKHRTSLGMDLTGCYTTLWASKDGRRAIEQASTATGGALLDQLKTLTGFGPDENPKDAEHPKVRAVVDEVLRRWDEGEKSLVFCFRVPTANTLNRLIQQGVNDRIEKARRAMLAARGTRRVDSVEDEQKAMTQFRRALTTREGSGVTLFLDRVLLGALLDAERPAPDVLDDADLIALAALCGRAISNDQPLFRKLDRPDRVFLHRATEHVLAIKLTTSSSGRKTTGREDGVPDPLDLLLRALASEDWIRARYGQVAASEAIPDDEAEHSDAAARSSITARFELLQSPDHQIEQSVLTALRQRQFLRPILSGPNLLVPRGEALDALHPEAKNRVTGLRRLLHQMSFEGGTWQWGERGRVLDAVVRAFLREDILFRLPSEIFTGEDDTWAQKLLRGFYDSGSAVPQAEPLAARIERFLGALAQMGPVERENHLRYAMNPKAQSVVLVTGDGKTDRAAVFNGFNTPLLPDVLVCTAVGQEGIDLHRECRHVVHYDLGWNPATIEQRTGRVDRIGSKIMHLRAEAETSLRASGADATEPLLPGLDVGLPYLAGTYDERMYETLRTRAQVFEILTGGDPTADREAEASWLDPDSEGEAGTSSFVALPRQMLEDLRVDLSVKRSANHKE